LNTSTEKVSDNGKPGAIRGRKTTGPDRKNSEDSRVVEEKDLTVWDARLRHMKAGVVVGDGPGFKSIDKKDRADPAIMDLINAWHKTSQPNEKEK
jgi:hypothetical protein